MDFKYLTDSSYSQEMKLEKKTRNLVREMHNAVLKNSSIINDIDYDFDNYVFIVSFFNTKYDQFALMIPMDGFMINLATTNEYYSDGLQQEIIDNWENIDRSNYMDTDIDYDEILEHGLEKECRIFILEE